MGPSRGVESRFPGDLRSRNLWVYNPELLGFIRAHCEYRLYVIEKNYFLQGEEKIQRDMASKGRQDLAFKGRSVKQETVR